MTPRLAALVLSACLAVPSRGLTLASSGQEENGPYLCPPCGAECHFIERDTPGKCSVCGMDTVPLAEILQVGVLVFPDVDAATTLLALTGFGTSNAVRAFTVADTTDPIRSSDLVELIPQFSFEEAPPLDVLIVPAGFAAKDDPLIVQWVGKAAARARFVLAAGMGNVVLAQAGQLDGARVPGFGRLSSRVAEWAPKLVLDEEARLVRNGKFFAARNAMTTLDGVLAILTELKGEELALRTARDLGYDWEPQPLDGER